MTTHDGKDKEIERLRDENARRADLAARHDPTAMPRATLAADELAQQKGRALLARRDAEIARLRNALRVIAGEPVAREPGGYMHTYGSSLYKAGDVGRYAESALRDDGAACWACAHGVPGCVHTPGALP